MPVEPLDLGQLGALADTIPDERERADLLVPEVRRDARPGLRVTIRHEVPRLVTVCAVTWWAAGMGAGLLWACGVIR